MRESSSQLALLSNEGVPSFHPKAESLPTYLTTMEITARPAWGTGFLQKIVGWHKTISSRFSTRDLIYPNVIPLIGKGISIKLASPILKINVICHTLEDFGDGGKDKELPT